MTKALILWDDLDFLGGDHHEADESVSFGLDGQAYTIDLTAPHAAELRKLLDRYTAVAEKVAAMAKPPRPRGQSRNGPMPTTNAAIKAFCEDPANAVPFEEWHGPNGKAYYSAAARTRFNTWLASQDQGGGSE
jgi:hypothetical protein